MAGGRTFDLGVEGLERGTRIGEGGNAVVYRARQPTLDRDVAVKILKEADSDTRRRFDRERRAMGRLSQHDGIVTVYDSGFTVHEEPYLIMPLLEGSLEDELRANGPMRWRDAVALMAEVCETVAYAHEQGVVHRDLKPANLMRTQTGRPLVADFGISRITDASASLKSTAITLTPAFSPPEALEAAPAAPSADVYSLGATLYALLAGHPPFMDDPDVSLIALMRQIIEAPVPPLPESVPEAVSTIVETAMAKNPANRYTDAGHMAAWLRHVLADPAAAVAVAESAAEEPTVEEPATAAPDARETQPVGGPAEPADAAQRPAAVSPTLAVSGDVALPEPSDDRTADRPNRLWALAPVAVLAAALALAGWLVSRGSDSADVAEAPAPAAEAAPAEEDVHAETTEDAVAGADVGAEDAEAVEDEVEEPLDDAFEATPRPDDGEEDGPEGGSGPPPVDLSGTSVHITGPESSELEAVSIQAALDEFADTHGMTITYVESVDWEVELNVQIASGNPPDIAIFNQPLMLADLARQGAVLPLPQNVVEHVIDNWGEPYLQSGNVDGRPHGIPNETEPKSLVWFQPARFEQEGYAIPESLEEFYVLTDRMIADGNTPLCVGIESGPATGWVFTDWVEDLLLRRHPVEVYDAWVEGNLPFASPEVSGVMQEIVDLWNTPGMVHAAAGSIATTSFAANAEPLIAGECMMHKQGSFFTSFFPDGTPSTLRGDQIVDVFYFPAGATERPMLHIGTWAGAFDDRPAVWAVMEFLASADYANARQRSLVAHLGGADVVTSFVTANRHVDRSLWAPVERRMLDILTSVEFVRYDASDIMPGEVGSGSFWVQGTAMVEGDVTVATGAAIVDRSWPG